jgi:hypothetical protein
MSDIMNSYLGLLSLGKSDFEAIEGVRPDRYFRGALVIGKMPGGVWQRQQLGVHAPVIREYTDPWSVVPITADEGFVVLDFDTFVMNNRRMQKACVGRTYQGVDGHTPISAYLGNEDCCVAARLRPHGLTHRSDDRYVRSAPAVGDYALEDG